MGPDAVACFDPVRERRTHVPFDNREEMVITAEAFSITSEM